MSSSDGMFEALSVYFRYVNERAARVKIDHISRRWAVVNLQFLAPLAIGQRAYVMVRCPLRVRPSVR